MPLTLIKLRAKLQKRLLLLGEGYAAKSPYEKNEVDIKRLETEIKIKILTRKINEIKL